MTVIESTEVIRSERRLVRVLIFLLVLSRVVFLGVVYLLAALKGYIDYPDLDVSDTYSIDPMRAVASFLLPISAMLIAVVVGLRMRRLRAVVHTVPQWTVWGLLIVGLFCTVFGLFGLAAVPKHVNFSLFYVFAAFWYIGSVLQVSLSTVLNILVELVQPNWLQALRIGLTASLVSVAIVLAVCITWQPLTDSIASMIMTVITVLYFASYGHQSEFPHRSHCPFASLSDIPPVPDDGADFIIMV